MVRDRTSAFISAGYYISLGWLLVSLSNLCANLLDLSGIPRTSVIGDATVLSPFISGSLIIGGIAVLLLVYTSRIKGKLYLISLLGGMLVAHIGKQFLNEQLTLDLLSITIGIILGGYAYFGFYQLRILAAADEVAVRRRNKWIALSGLVLAGLHFWLTF